METETTLVIDEDKKIDNPTWENVISAIENMDGLSRTMVTLISRKETALLIGGGNNENFLISYYPNFSGQVSLFLSDPNKQGDDIKITTQTSEMFPARWVADNEVVVKVARFFYETGELSNEYQWEEG